MAEMKNISLNNVNTVNINGKNYTVIDRKVIEESNGLGLNTRELFLYLYREIQKDPYQKERFDNLSDKEKINYLAKEVMKLKKTHDLEHSSNQAKPNDKAGAVTKIIANGKTDEAYINQNLGIIESDGVITTIEEQTDGKINVNEIDNSNSDSMNVTTIGTDLSNDIDTMNSDNINFNDTYLSNDNSEIVNDINSNNQEMESNNVQEQRQEASISHSPHSTRFVRTLRPNTLQPNQRYRATRANGFIENSIIITILGLSTILGLIIGSIIALYK